MAISVVQRTAAGNAALASTIPLAYVSNVTAGSILIAIGVTSSTLASLTGLTDSLNNTWTRLQTLDNNQVGASNKFKIWYCQTTAGANTVTLTTGLQNSGLHIFEASGLANTSSFDRFAAVQQQAVTSLSSPATSNTRFANELVIGFFINSDIAVLGWTIGGGFSNLTKQDTTFCNSMTEELIVSTVGTQTSTATLAANGDNIVSAVITFSDTPISGAAMFGNGGRYMSAAGGNGISTSGWAN